MEEAVFAVLADWLLGSVLDTLPLDISSARRMRRYRAGHRVFFRARVSGLPGAQWAVWVAAERGRLWTATRKGDERGLVPVPLPHDAAVVVVNARATWSESRFVAYEVDGLRVQISCMLDWDLLRLAVSEGIGGRQQSGAQPQS
jgi:hypothetical protein